MLAGVSQPGFSGDLAYGHAQVAEWLMAADCKSAAPWSYGGSNPPLCTISSGEAACRERWEGVSRARG